MKKTNCPLCHGLLEVKTVTPCQQCGTNSDEIIHYKVHEYNEYEVFEGLNLILCNFCDVDFGSFDPTFFGLPKGTNVGYEKLKFVKEISEISLNKDKYCPSCGYRLAFLRFIAKSRENLL